MYTMLKPHIASLQRQHGAQRLAAAPMMGAMDTAVTDADVPAASARSLMTRRWSTPLQQRRRRTPKRVFGVRRTCRLGGAFELLVLGPVIPQKEEEPAEEMKTPAEEMKKQPEEMKKPPEEMKKTAEEAEKMKKPNKMKKPPDGSRGGEHIRRGPGRESELREAPPEAQGSQENGQEEGSKEGSKEESKLPWKGRWSKEGWRKGEWRKEWKKEDWKKKDSKEEKGLQKEEWKKDWKK
ncbi:unnamed protein product, partial [Effrenium voratum]